jgi:hypothetical protein
MDALFVGFLTTYSHTYSGGTKTLAPYYAMRYITPMPNKTAQGDKPSSGHRPGSLKIISLRISSCKLRNNWQPFGVVGAHSRRERELTRQREEQEAAKPRRALGWAQQKPGTGH